MNYIKLFLVVLVSSSLISKSLAQSENIQELIDLGDEYVGNDPVALDSIANVTLKLCFEQNDTKNASIAYMQIGIAKAMMGQHAHALHNLNRAWELAKEIDHKRLMVNVLTNMAGVHQLSNNPEKAKVKLEIAIEILESTDGTLTRANTYLTLSMVQEEMGDIKASRGSVAKAMEIFHDAKNVDRYFYCVEQLGNLLVRDKQYSEAIKVYNFAINGWLWKEEMGKLIALHTSRGKAFFLQKEFTKAKLDLGFAYDLADSFNITHSNDTILVYQLKAAATLGENHLIAIYTDRLTKFLYKREQKIADEKVAEMENDCMISQHEMEMKLKSAEERLISSEEEAKRNLWLLAGGSLLLIVLSFALNRNRRGKA
ncbi:MAG: hypothetical protein Salg2KO_14520 [Salibacteraceae bacterium]